MSHSKHHSVGQLYGKAEPLAHHMEGSGLGGGGDRDRLAAGLAAAVARPALGTAPAFAPADLAFFVPAAADTARAPAPLAALAGAAWRPWCLACRTLPPVPVGAAEAPGGPAACLAAAAWGARPLARLSQGCTRVLERVRALILAEGGVFSAAREPANPAFAAAAPDLARLALTLCLDCALVVSALRSGNALLCAPTCFSELGLLVPRVTWGPCDAERCLVARPDRCLAGGACGGLWASASARAAAPVGVLRAMQGPGSVGVVSAMCAAAAGLLPSLVVVGSVARGLSSSRGLR